ncbi:V-type ATP synthase subunit D [Modicisalibacter tunisiensis]|uniref:V-type ATP synthase subunit D n=1 Tax=Modicisalibacter tunisiensis TaxID=390637 RepID=UPI000795968C|nr:V-type ATP synthase subunit D [Modicisalibacter tunisiensis]KXS37532.1 MAG: V-type H+-transporting ATPase subunit D [Halomonadaceae bacterium T82-2]MBZ9539539.1 V-type ATP synthase subunit D [Modicisalibacter tunisiensis]
MQTPALNKSSLSRLERQRTLYRRYLPALEMKQRTLLIQRQQSAEHLATLRERAERQQAAVGRELPMLADTDVPLERLVRVATLRLGRENRVGVSLPTLAELTLERTPYDRLVQPHWIDTLVERLETRLRLEVETRVEARRLARLDDAVRTVTQRVNLFSKVMIPRVEKAIARIELYLADQERAAVVRAKLAKRKLAAGGREATR